MNEHFELESLYLEAKRLIKSKDFSSASTLLKQILEEDEGYKDASRLLSSIVQKKRYRWYKDWRVWGVVLVALVALSAWIFLPKILTSKSQQIEPSIFPTSTVAFQAPVPTPAATELPATNNSTYSWKRINSLKEFEREQVTSVAVYPKDPSIMYATTNNAGIYKTIDGGKSWSPILTGLGEDSFKTILVHPENPESAIVLSTVGKIFATYNGGKEWTFLENVDEFGGFLVQDPTDPQHLVSRKSGVIYSSQDWGKTWKTIDDVECANGFIDIKIDPGNNQEWIAVTDDGDKDSSTCPGGVYRSMDGGKTWSTPETVLHNVMAVDISGDYIYALTGRSAEVYVSPDRGNTWTGPYQPNGNRCRNLQVDPIDSLRAYCLIYLSQEKNSELWVTTNAGVSWEKQTSLGIIASIIELVPTLPDEIIIGGFGFEVSKDKGNTWETRQNGLGAREFAIKFDPWGGSELYAYDMFCMDYSKLYKSQDNGLNFEDISPPSQFDACDLAFGFGNQIYRWQYSWFFNSPDSGETWVENQLQNESDFINGFGASPYSDGTLLYTLMFTNGIFKSTDGGDSWTLVDETGDTQRDFYFASEKSKRVYSSAGNVMVSDDLGSSWRTCGDPRAYADRNSNNFVIDPENDDIIYLTTADKGVLTSTDGCGSWSTINNGIGSLTVNTVAVHPNDSQKLFAGTVNGAYLSLDRGKSWFEVNDGLLGATIIYSFAISPTDGTVLAATPYGVFKLIDQD